MDLGNDIAFLTKKYEEIEQEKSELQATDEESSAKSKNLKSELSQVFFAIDTIESLCSKRSEFNENNLPYSKSS